ncbi:MAG: MerR family transcriptional regulator [Oscillospiraceae bacterium]
MNKEKSGTYSTSQIAEIVGLHPNTVRMYEEWGLVSKPERQANGYRIYTDIHIKQFRLARKALQIEVLQAGLRKRIIETLKLSAQYRFDEAIKLTEEYIRIAEQEKENAKEAAEICEMLYRQKPQDDGIVYKRSQAAKELGLTIDTIRNWEMNGLLTVKRKQNGYRMYDSNDINRLKIIRSLRCANYSLSAILRMLKKLDSGMDKDVFYILNTPEEDEDIISACDKLVVSLENAIRNAYEAIAIIIEIKQIKN